MQTSVCNFVYIVTILLYSIEIWNVTGHVWTAWFWQDLVNIFQVQDLLSQSSSHRDSSTVFIFHGFFKKKKKPKQCNCPLLRCFSLWEVVFLKMERVERNTQWSCCIIWVLFILMNWVQSQVREDLIRSYISTRSYRNIPVEGWFFHSLFSYSFGSIHCLLWLNKGSLSVWAFVLRGSYSSMFRCLLLLDQIA